MTFKIIVGIYLFVIGLLVSNVLSMAWMVLVQLAAIAGLLLIGSVVYHGKNSSGDDD